MFGKKKNKPVSFPMTTRMCALLNKIRACDYLLKNLDRAEKDSTSDKWMAVHWYDIVIRRHRLEEAGISIKDMHKFVRQAITERKAMLAAKLTQMGAE